MKKILTLIFLVVIATPHPSFTRATNRPDNVVHNVPFLMQVPMGEWDDPRQLDGCEETSLLMAISWINGGTVPPEEVRRDIIAMSEYERVIWGFYHDTSIDDTARLLSDFYQYRGTVKKNVSAEDIKNEIAAGNVVIIPLNMRLTSKAMHRNGPTRHTVIAVGYDDHTNEIIINDPFIKNGQRVRISSKGINNALWDYNSGPRVGSGPKRSAMLVIGK